MYQSYGLISPKSERLATQAGAFPLAAGSRDAALHPHLEAGVYSLVIDAKSTAGVALAEIYDLGPAVHLANVSARVYVGSGEEVGIVGFVIAGNAPKTVLIRGIGPTLANYQVAGFNPDPRVTIFSGNVPVASL